MNSPGQMFMRLLVFAILVGIAGSVHGQAHERARVLSLLGKSYPRVNDPEKMLFEFDRFHVIRAEFDKQKRLIELAVEPKYYFEHDHEGWGQSDDFTNLSPAEFFELSTKLKQIKALGKIVRPVDKFSAVTNMTAWYSEYYRNASFTWGVVVDLRKGDKPPSEVRWFRIKYGANAEKPRKRLNSNLKNFKFPSNPTTK